jgi:ABC-type Fe3+ transport system substrate-binding protein
VETSITRLTRRTLLQRSLAISGGAAAVSLVPTAPWAQVSAAQGDTTPLTEEQVVEALKAEGATVTLKSWGFGGLNTDQFPQRFREYTEQTYGVPVELVWDADDAILDQYEQANKPIGEALDVLDKEEDFFPRLKLLEWIEPINLPQYKEILTNWDRVEPAYIVEDGLGVIYQGFEWLGMCVRKDQVDPESIKDWTDLANPEFKGKIISYPMDEYRGQLIFTGILNSLIKQGTVKGDLFAEETWIEGLKWYKANIAPNILKFIDNDEMRTMAQSGQASVILTWGSYVRELQGADWNLREPVIVPIYPASGMATDRETITTPHSSKHPVTARVAVNWMLSRDFLMVGWYKDPETGEEKNRWDLDQRQFLVAYAGGINAEDRTLVPDWAKSYYPEDPSTMSVAVDQPWLASHIEWTWEQYQQL